MSNFDLISRLLFPVPPPSYGVDSFPKELIWIPRGLDPTTATPEEHVPCLFFPCASARFILLYLHSNGEDLGKCHAFCSTARLQFEVHVFAVEYPGYGICPGSTCNEQGVTENALTGLLFINKILRWPLDSILLMGRSIGCGPALFLAVRYKVFGVIIVSPMLSFKERCRDIAGPFAGLLNERFPNKVWIPFIRSQLLVVHGQKDQIVPCRHGVELFNECRVHKQLVCPQDMAHNDNLFADATYFAIPMFHFFPFPDYSFQDIEIPKWAYDKRSSPYYQATASLCGCRVLARHSRGEDCVAASVQRLFFSSRTKGLTAPLEVPGLPVHHSSSLRIGGHSPRQEGSLSTATGRHWRARRPPDMHVRSASRNRLETVSNFGSPSAAGETPAIVDAGQTVEESKSGSDEAAWSGDRASAWSPSIGIPPPSLPPL